jgi:hypothetical protein
MPDGERGGLTEAELEQQRQALSGGTGAEIVLIGDEEATRMVVDCDRAAVHAGFVQFRDAAGEFVRAFNRDRVVVIEPIGSFSMPADTDE